MLSIIVITKNESQHIERCLQSVSWADEIIVFDSGSTDNTVEICKNYTSLVFETDWPGFGHQKQRALDKTSGDWVLSIDADEYVSEKLRTEIQVAIQQTDIDGFEMPRLSSYCGKQIKHGGWWPDYVLRLFQKKHGKFSTSLVHERVIVNTKTARMANPLLHDSYISLEEVLSKTNSYSSLGAKMLYEKGEKSSLSKAIFTGNLDIFSHLLYQNIFPGRRTRTHARNLKCRRNLLQNMLSLICLTNKTNQLKKTYEIFI